MTGIWRKKLPQPHAEPKLSWIGAYGVACFYVTERSLAYVLHQGEPLQRSMSYSIRARVPSLRELPLFLSIYSA